MKNFTMNIDIEDYNYDLPEDRIAQYPVEERDNSQLLLYFNGNISKDKFRNIHDYLPVNSILVFNNTRVIRARLIFQKETGANIEIFCLEPLVPNEYEKSFSSLNPVEWKCIAGNLKKWKSGTLSTKFLFKGNIYELLAEKTGQEGETIIVRFSWNPDDISFGEVTDAVGHIPLPPYVKRNDGPGDNFRYQTVYSRVKGSVAAPTAGLHFSDKVLYCIKNKGIKSAELTLHIGAGTFKPIKSNDILKHEMHGEHFIVKKEVIETLLSCKDKIIAVGTTSVRTLESLYWLGVKMIKEPSETFPEYFIGQWEPYESAEEVPLAKSLEALMSLMSQRKIECLHCSTKIIIVPGYKFRVISGMITNFHQPKSTLLLLISAWVGNDWKEIYSFALNNSFRFLSYGDTSLLMNQPFTQ
jgi:S-adenosylmethionine:tRNA ribosyltransferase-isomerase